MPHRMAQREAHWRAVRIRPPRFDGLFYVRLTKLAHLSRAATYPFMRHVSGMRAAAVPCRSAAIFFCALGAGLLDWDRQLKLFETEPLGNLCLIFRLVCRILGCFLHATEMSAEGRVLISFRNWNSFLARSPHLVLLALRNSRILPLCF